MYLDATASSSGTNDAQIIMRTGSSPTEALRIDRSQNATFAGDISVGGNTLNTWNSLHSAVQLGYGAFAVRQNNNTTYLTNNLY